MQLAPGLHRLGDGLVNSYLVAETARSPSSTPASPGTAACSSGAGAMGRSKPTSGRSC